MNLSLEQITRLLATISPNIRATLIDHQPGQPRAQAYDSDRTTSGQGPADPTAAAAHIDDYGWTKAGDGKKRTTGTRHPAAAALTAYDDAIIRIIAALNIIANIQEQYCPPHATPRTRAKQETRGCELHRRAGIDKHRPMVHRTNFDDVLDTPLKDSIDVCRWCYDFPRRIHPVTSMPVARLATPEEIRTYERTGKLRLVTKRGRAA